MKTFLMVWITIFLIIPTKAQDFIHYFRTSESIFEYGELKAVVNDNVYTLINIADETCFNIVREEDFNRDGFNDILIQNVIGCGGNCCGNSYQIFCYDGHKFQKTEQIGYDWDGIEIAESSVEYNFIVQTVHAGIGNTDMCRDKIETYRISGYKLELINVIQDQKLNAITEITADDFEGRENEELFLTYDLDGDNNVDKITCRYWSRWGCISKWKIKFGNGIIYEEDSNPKRIGVLNTKTHGVNDLVIECDNIRKWDGVKYE